MFPPPVANGLLIVSLVIITGALHLDGFIDTCDGIAGHKPAEARWQVMHDSRTGAFGVVGAVLLLLLQCYHIGLEVGRYISLERLIEQNKERYYETLEQSSQGWHEGKHDPWPYINYLLFILKNAYRELVDRVGDTQAPRGAKTELAIGAIAALPAEFTLAQLELACPGVSRDMVRWVLNAEKGNTVECIGRGPGAKWKKKG